MAVNRGEEQENPATFELSLAMRPSSLQDEALDSD